MQYSKKVKHNANKSIDLWTVFIFILLALSLNYISFYFFVPLITDRGKLPANVQIAIQELQDSTALCTSFTVNICLSYGARGDICNACREIGGKIQSGEMQVQDINEEQISKFLSTKNCPDPDILIRTSGEYRLSNFLLWQVQKANTFLFVYIYIVQLLLSRFCIKIMLTSLH